MFPPKFQASRKKQDTKLKTLAPSRGADDGHGQRRFMVDPGSFLKGFEDL